MQQREDSRTKYEAEQLERNCRVHGGNVLPPAFIQILTREMMMLYRAERQSNCSKTVRLEVPVLKAAS